MTDTYFEVESDKYNFNCKYDSNKKHLAFFKKGAVEPCSTCTSMLADEFEADGTRGKASPDYFLCVNGKPNEFYPEMSRIFDVAQTDNKIRFTIISGSMPKHHEGCYLTATDHERRNNAVYFYRCKNITIQDIDMYTSLSFGVIGLLCENVTIQCVNSILKPGTDNKLAVVADMFHMDKYTIWGIPVTETDDEFVGLVTQALCEESYKTVYPAFYDVALKNKYSTDKGTAEMVDLLMSGATFDVAFMFEDYCGKIQTLIREHIKNNDPDFASDYTSRTFKLDELYEALK